MGYLRQPALVVLGRISSEARREMQPSCRTVDGRVVSHISSGRNLPFEVTVDGILPIRCTKAQLDKTHFAWHGPHKPGSDASYHIYGPGVIIEYMGQDLGGDPLDHLHSIYRDPTNEYGVKWAKKK